MCLHMYECVFVCVNAVKRFALGFRLSQFKLISLQLISKRLSFHQQPHQSTCCNKLPLSLSVLSPPIYSMCVFMCVRLPSQGSLFTSDLQAVREKVTPHLQSLSLIHMPLSFLSLSMSFYHSLTLSPNLIGYHSPLVALVFHRYLCLLSHFSTHHPLLHLCHAVFDLLCVSLSPPCVSIFNLSLSPTSQLWLFKMNGEEKGR